MNSTAKGIIDGISSLIIQPIISLLFAVGFLVFMWGMIEFIYDPTDTTRKATGKKHMIYGVLGLLIMVSIWGVVGLVLSTLGIDCNGLSGGRPCQ